MKTVFVFFFQPAVLDYVLFEDPPFEDIFPIENMDFPISWCWFSRVQLQGKDDRSEWSDSQQPPGILGPSPTVNRRLGLVDLGSGSADSWTFFEHDLFPTKLDFDGSRGFRKYTLEN